MENITYSSFLVSNWQATVYTPEGDFSTSKVMSLFYPKWAKTFDADPEVIPKLPVFPVEIPRITLRNQENSLRLEIAAARLNLFGESRESESPDELLVSFFKDAIDIFRDYHEITGFGFGRLAAIIKRYAKHESPGYFLARHFCKERWDDEPFDRPTNFEIHAHKTFSFLGEFKVNSWARSKTGRFVKEGKKFPIILFEQDINTLAEEANERAFNLKEIQQFFTNVLSEFDGIHRLYYPEY